jgi:predicted  nucleic acid-binding Zn-ribbon protein
MPEPAYRVALGGAEAQMGPLTMIDQDAADLYERLRITLDRADGGRVKIADEIEYVLTEGYAYALNLELRPQRIEKRIVSLVTSGETDSDELRKLAREKLDTDRELVSLRETLARLQEHCDSLKAEGRVAMPEPQLVRPAEPPDST